MKRLIFVIGLLTASCSAQTLFRFQKFCEQGGSTVATQGMKSATTVQQSFPSCTVTVYLTGTTNLATIFSDQNSTPLSNPFTANTDGSFGFYASGSSCYDITTSGGNPPNNLPNPFTYTAVCVGSGGSGLPVPVSLANGGTNTATPCASTSALFFFTGVNFGCDSNTQLDGNGNLSLNMINVTAFTLRGPGTGVLNLGEGIAPSPPASGINSLYVDMSTHLLSCKNHTDGSCLNGVFGAVLLNPSGPQIVSQPLSSGISTGTFFNNLSNIRYAQQLNWTQSPSGSISAGSNTVTLTPCPPGIDASATTNSPYYVYVAGTGTPEAVLLTGGTCTAGASSGTIIFTAVNSHAAGFTIGSASSGLKEAINDAGTPNGQVVIYPVGANANELQIYAPVYVNKNVLTVNGYGGMVRCNTRSSCLVLGDAASGSTDFQQITLKGLRFDAGTSVTGVQITNIAITSNVLTVTTNSAHNFSTTANAGGSDIVWAMIYAAGLEYHGMLTVASTPSGTTYTAPFTHANVSSQAAFGWTGLENDAIEDNAQQSSISDVIPSGAAGGNFNFFFIDDNDQATNLDRINTDSGSGISNCSPTFCGALVLGRGDGSNSNVIWFSHSNLNLQCATNGVLALSGNSLHETDDVIQGFPQYGTRYQAGNQNAFQTNVYHEVGSCTNPFYPGSLQAQAGFIHQGQNLYIAGGSAASGPLGNFPLFANTGATQYNYYIVPKDSVAGYGAVLYIGSALTNGSGNIVVSWPAINPFGLATITYDLLRVTGVAGSIATPYSGFTGNISVATNNSGSCAAGMCAFTDTQASLGSYTVQTQAMWGGYYFWPGGVVLAMESNSNSSWGPDLYTDFTPAGIASAAGEKTPSVFSKTCPADPGTYSPVWVQCLAGDDSVNITGTATVLPQVGDTGAGPSGNLKGRLNFENTGTNNGPLDLITWHDSNINRTLGTAGYRPTADANDSATGQDQAGGLFNRAHTSLSRYIGEVADNSTWLERLTSTTDTYLVPLTFGPSLAYMFTGTEQSTPGSNPGAGLEQAYFKAGSGLCALDHSGTERCTGGNAGVSTNFWNSPWGGGSNVTFPTANATKLYAVNITTSLVGAQHLYYHVATADNTANLYDVGLYNASGTLICDLGATAGTSFAPSIGDKSIAIGGGSGCTTTPGRYYIALTDTVQTANITGQTSIWSPACGVAPATGSTTSGGALNGTVTFSADAASNCTVPNIALAP